MSHRAKLVSFAALSSAALLIGAWGFQALGYAPCKMCIWQRWPHAAAAVIGVLFAVVPAQGIRVLLIWLGAGMALTTSAIGAYHSGVEQKWWAGPTSCSGGGSLQGLSGDDLLSTEQAGRIVMCDEIAWSFAGLSMASWNAILALGLTLIWLRAAMVSKSHGTP